MIEKKVGKWRDKGGLPRVHTGQTADIVPIFNKRGEYDPSN